MKKFYFLFALLFMLFSCSTPLPKDNWSEINYKVLNELINQYKNNKDAYAVFDFDNTTIINDVEMSLVTYQLDNLKLKIGRDDMYKTLIQGISDINKNIRISDKITTVKDLAYDAAEDYKYLYDNYINLVEKDTLNTKKFLNNIVKTKEYQDFRAKVWAIGEATNEAYSYRTGCIWILNLLNNMTAEEVTKLTIESTKWAMSIKNPHLISWESPDYGKVGKVKVNFPIGIKLTKSIKDLYKAFKDNNIEVYICSASFQIIVQSVACNPEFGLNIPKDHVFGLRISYTGNNTIQTRLDSNYIATYKEGKAQAIKKYMSPSHNYKSPIFVAGDSSGDYNMLTEFLDLDVALVINCNHGKPMSNLYDIALKQNKDNELLIKGKTRVLLQGRNPYEGCFVKSSNSVDFK